jgi:hypothetical protein
VYYTAVACIRPLAIEHGDPEVEVTKHAITGVGKSRIEGGGHSRALPVPLTPHPLLDNLSDMRTNVSELLRNFPKVRRAALAGERVIIQTREGNLVLTAERPAASTLFGSMAGAIDSGSLTPEQSGADEADWDPSL